MANAKRQYMNREQMQKLIDEQEINDILHSKTEEDAVIDQLRQEWELEFGEESDLDSEEDEEMQEEQEE